MNLTYEQALKNLEDIINKVYQEEIQVLISTVLIENGVENVKCHIDNDSKQKSTALFNNYKDGFISKKDECKVIKQIIDLNPYRKDIYE